MVDLGLLIGEGHDRKGTQISDKEPTRTQSAKVKITCSFLKDLLDVQFPGDVAKHASLKGPGKAFVCMNFV